MRSWIFHQLAFGRFSEVLPSVNPPERLELMLHKQSRACGACQGGCRFSHAANGCLSSLFRCSATTASRSGLRLTAPTGDQSRVLPDQRAERVVSGARLPVPAATWWLHDPLRRKGNEKST